MLEKAFIVVLVVLSVLLAELVVEPDGVKREVALKPDIVKLESTSAILFQDYSDSLVLV